MKRNFNRLKFIMLLSCIFLLLILFLPIGSTGADSTTPQIKIDTLPAHVVFDIENFKPGDWAPRELIIQNNGNQDFLYNIKSTMKSGSEILYKQLQIKVESQASVLFEGGLDEFIGFKSPRSLTSFSEEKLKVTVSFPYESGNEFQGLSTVVELHIHAEGDSPDDPGKDDDDDGNHPPDKNEPPNNNPTPTKPADPPNKDTGSLPQTGEENPFLILLTGFFISLAGLGLLLVKKSILPNPFKRG
ncbi:LPXTG cell wall anchor domain-containing protein [Fictibacillus nanhaiensis]|uniref:LPXTG cell wall anchor domain-containing protein n=1 Tax=Fictibacillus nanhaiensis TaxID=742169 RepID=UPI001C9371AA|nr:LPXTG cell wall anchor domain-containing protein [Fictibacillus nanhaiensis]MBY6037206.1 LPXTG cell wall anchor domain-containing protein [Fictibacillus nanhaiensis]